jgi:hypothetical protein
MLQHGPTSGPPPAHASRGPPRLRAPPAAAAPGGILAASWRPRWPTGFDVYRFSEARRRKRRQGAHGPRGKALVGGSRRGPPRRRDLVLLPPASCGIVQDGPKQSSEIYSAQLPWEKGALASRQPRREACRAAARRGAPGPGPRWSARVVVAAPDEEVKSNQRAAASSQPSTARRPRQKAACARGLITHKAHQDFVCMSFGARPADLESQTWRHIGLAARGAPGLETLTFRCRAPPKNPRPANMRMPAVTTSTAKAGANPGEPAAQPAAAPAGAAQ